MSKTTQYYYKRLRNRTNIFAKKNCVSLQNFYSLAIAKFAVILVTNPILRVGILMVILCYCLSTSIMLLSFYFTNVIFSTAYAEETDWHEKTIKEIIANSEAEDLAHIQLINIKPKMNIIRRLFNKIIPSMSRVNSGIAGTYFILKAYTLSHKILINENVNSNTLNRGTLFTSGFITVSYYIFRHKPFIMKRPYTYISQFLVNTLLTKTKPYFTTFNMANHTKCKRLDINTLIIRFLNWSFTYGTLYVLQAFTKLSHLQHRLNRTFVNLSFGPLNAIRNRTINWFYFRSAVNTIMCTLLNFDSEFSKLYTQSLIVQLFNCLQIMSVRRNKVTLELKNNFDSLGSRKKHTFKPSYYLKNHILLQLQFQSLFALWYHSLKNVNSLTHAKTRCCVDLLLFIPTQFTRIPLGHITYNLVAPSSISQYVMIFGFIKSIIKK